MESGTGKVVVGRGDGIGVDKDRGAGVVVGAGKGVAGAQANNRLAIETVTTDRKSSLAAAFFGEIQATG